MLGTILKFALYIGLGLLFLDLVPLQESMRCMHYENTTTCPEAFWAQDYYAARGKFRMLAKLAGAELQARVVVQDDLTIDMAVFKGRADRVIVHASGTHGVEGFVGSAIQAKLLSEWNGTSADAPTVIFVHAVNPYGFAHLRRFNEENVDLNRNHLTAAEWAAVRERDPNVAGFDDLWAAMDIQRPPNVVDRYAFFLNAVKFVVTNGLSAFKRALVTGQYHNKSGVFFGGVEPQESLEALEELLTPYMAQAKDTIFIDVHSGLGPQGVDTFMFDTPALANVGRSIWPPQRIEASGEGDAASGYELVVGTLSVAKMFPSVRVIEVTEEFGTVAPVFVARALFLENAAFNHARDSHLHEMTRFWLRDVFYPQNIRFKSAVLKNGQEAFWRAFDFLRDTADVGLAAAEAQARPSSTITTEAEPGLKGLIKRLVKW